MLKLDPLQPTLDQFRADWEARVGETIARMIAGDIADLRASGVLDGVAKAGNRFPIGTGGPGQTTTGRRRALIDIQRGLAPDRYGWVDRLD